MYTIGLSIPNYQSSTENQQSSTENQQVIDPTNINNVPPHILMHLNSVHGVQNSIQNASENASNNQNTIHHHHTLFQRLSLLQRQKDETEELIRTLRAMHRQKLLENARLKEEQRRLQSHYSGNNSGSQELECTQNEAVILESVPLPNPVYR